MKRWRIPRPKMTTTNNSVRNGQQQQQPERRPADPPRDYLVNDSSEQETSGGHLSANEGSPGSSSTNADDWITNLIPPSSCFIYILPDDPVRHSFDFGFCFLLEKCRARKRRKEKKKKKKKNNFSSRVFISYWLAFQTSAPHPLPSGFWYRIIMEQCWLYIKNQRSV